jgi:hypothetical protein
LPELEENKTEVEEKIVSRARPKKINLNKDILCKNLTSSKLIFRSKKTGYEVTWTNHGDEQYVDAKELVDMRSSQPKFLEKPWLYIEDDSMVEHLGLTTLYKQISSAIDTDKIFAMKPIEMKKVVAGLPEELRKSVRDEARKAIKNGNLDNLRSIQILQKELKVNLLQELDDVDEETEE